MKKQSKLKILDTCLEISGLEQPLTLLQITDLHLINTDEQDGTEIQTLGRKYAEWFPFSNEILDEIGAYCKINHPDAIIFTGDTAGFPTRRNLQILQNFLDHQCSPYLFIFGNHERIFTLKDLQADIQKQYTQMYSFAFQKDSRIQVMELSGIRLIGIDNSNNQISSYQLERLKELFQDGIPCVLFFHVPMYLPGLLQPVLGTWKQPFLMGTPLSSVPDMNQDLIPTASTQSFVELMTTHQTPVQAMFAGHIHFFDREDEFFPKKKQYVTPMSTTLDGCGLARLIRCISCKKEK